MCLVQGYDLLGGIGTCRSLEVGESGKDVNEFILERSPMDAVSVVKPAVIVMSHCISGISSWKCSLCKQ